jgi:DNA-binding response OmpR family regulator
MSAAMSADAAQAHVLLVEDSELVAGAMTILFEAAGHRMSTAASIAEALGVGRADPAALVLLDLTLPDGDGLTLIEPLRTAGSIKFVALTGHDDLATRQRCLNAGCDDVLIKPVPARELIARANALIDSGG